jgi:hypothetical protein
MWVVFVLLAAAAAFRFYAIWKTGVENSLSSIDGISWGEKQGVYGDRPKSAPRRWNPV